MLRIKKVYRNSIAKRLGLEKGDEILRIDGFDAVDALDAVYAESKDGVAVTVKDKRTGEVRDVFFKAEYEGEPWGLDFVQNTEIRTCHNRCIFCFVDQMPSGMRESLYVKDDDYTMSFTCGNFVTLTNLSKEELARIVRLQMSPLYISVHTMNPELRVKMLRNRFAGKIVEQVETLVKGGIELHTQAVIVPSLNDGEELKRTARELFAYYPAVKDLAVVPTGITKYRAGLYEIPDVDKAYANAFLDLVDALNAEFGVPFIQPADEYFVRAERERKPLAFYGDLEQIENGVGMTEKVWTDFTERVDEFEDGAKLKRKKTSLLISGVSAEAFNQKVAETIMQKVQNLTVSVLAVENEFFGKTVTCTGLLTGKDVLSAIKAYEESGNTFDEVVLPANVLMETEDKFLCGTTLKEFRKKLRKKRVLINRDGGVGLAETLIQEL